MAIKATTQLELSKCLAVGSGGEAVQHVIDILVERLDILLGLVQQIRLAAPAPDQLVGFSCRIGRASVCRPERLAQSPAAYLGRPIHLRRTIVEGVVFLLAVKSADSLEGELVARLNML